MGTVALARTRRYHGLLIIATRPPVGRILCVGGITEQVSTPWGPDRHLGAQRWASGVVDPRGHELIEEVRIDGGLPTWRIAIDAEVLRAWRECSRFGQASAARDDPAVPSAEQPMVTTSGETRA